MGMQPGADDPDSVAGKIVALLKGYVDAGKTGIAVGEGFYRYDAEGNVVEQGRGALPKGFFLF